MIVNRKVKCECMCHKEGYNVKHCFPCCNNGYKNQQVQVEKLLVKKDIVYGGYEILNGTEITIEYIAKNKSTVNVYFNYNGNDYTIGTPPYEIKHTLAAEKSIDEIVTGILIIATSQNKENE